MFHFMVFALVIQIIKRIRLAVPTGRRSKLCWTEEKAAALREAMTKFTPRDIGPISKVQILECGRCVSQDAVPE
uniref:HTH myb-type domain-containing protein n=1 Tax=Arundo donax TaxID=35708 RepID=A0A0A9H6H8_ARUDO